ncbi:MAG: hypothetical protein Q9227_004246 [Pyrenula ochraceoflavens]
MSNVADYLLAVDNDKSNAQSIAEDTARTELENRETTLIETVESLREYINDDDTKLRGRAVSYLTTVLNALPSNFLSRQQIQVLCQFYCDRIEDGGALDGLTYLQGLNRFTTDMAQMTARAILEHFQDLQMRAQSGRYRVLQLLNELFQSYRKALKLMGDEFLVGATDLFGGEKDPRNLMLMFSILRVMMVEWDISNHIERLFDSVYTYFPITFRPPPNDPYGISAQDLKDRLQDCLSSTPLLAPYVMPNLLDKLDSTSPVVKKDVLRALTACAAVYDTRTMAQYSISLWDSLKFEVLNAQEPDLAEETKSTLKAIALCLSRGQSTNLDPSSLSAYLRAISKECNEHLQEPTQRQAKASGEILGSLCTANSLSFTFLMKATLPFLFTSYQDAGTIPRQRSLLEVFNQLWDAGIEVLGTRKTHELKVPVDDLVDKFREQALSIYSQALMGTVKEEVSFRCTAARGLLKLSMIRGLMQEDEIGLIVQHFDEIVLKEETYGNDELKRVAIESLAELSKHQTQPIMDITFPAFIAQLPQDDSEAEIKTDYETTLDALAEISIEKEPFNTLIRRLLNKLDVLLSTNNFEHPAYTQAILSTILFVLSQRGHVDDIELVALFDRVVFGLTRKVLAPRMAEGSLTALNAEPILDVLGQLCNVIVRQAPLEKKLQASTNIYNLFVPDRPSVDNELIVRDNVYTETVILSTWFLAAMPRDMEGQLFQSLEVCRTVQKLSDLLLGEENATIRTMLLRQVALYVNKHIAVSELTNVMVMVDRLYDSIQSSPQQLPSVPSESEPSSRPRDTVRASSPFNVLPTIALRRTNTLRLIFTLTSALTHRLAPQTTTLLTRLASLLSLPRPIPSHAAQGFSTLLSLSPVLTPKNHYLRRPLVPQRVFTTLLPILSTGIRNSTNNTEQKAHYLTTLTSLLPTIPSEVLLPELPTLTPLLLQSLDLPSSDVKTAALETLSAVISSSPATIVDSGHVSSLVHRLLACSSISASSTKTMNPLTLSSNTPRVRLAALKCLAAIPGSLGRAGEGKGERELIMIKATVVKGLVKVLDDPRREVRREGVKGRGAWLRGMGEGDEGEESE